ncbi:hypothetical protein [Rhizobium rhizogenes]|uniref:hypothetical protein n=1 Tax=Rhizobium rhizogenes TaxID=359 RepID=UPI00068FE21F|nr:hypothetical protein [Rhizobium rhizogenes]
MNVVEPVATNPIRSVPRDGRERHHRIYVDHRGFSLDIARQHGKVRHEQELKLAPFRCLGLLNLIVEIDVIRRIASSHAPGWEP